MKDKAKTPKKAPCLRRVYMVHAHRVDKPNGARTFYEAGTGQHLPAEIAQSLIDLCVAVPANDKNEPLELPAAEARSVPEAAPVVHDGSTLEAPED